MTKIAFVTDTHESPAIYTWLEWAAKKYDIVAIGGDLTNSGAGGLQVVEQVVSIAIKAGNMPMVLGNHDWPVGMTERGILHGTTMEMAGLKIGGIGGSLPAGNWPFQLDETEYYLLLKKMPKVDILITHQPPFETECDIVNKGGFIQYPVGSKAVKDYIKRKQPCLVLTGHIHESQGIDKIGTSTIVNPGSFRYDGSFADIMMVKPHIHVEFKRAA